MAAKKNSRAARPRAPVRKITRKAQRKTKGGFFSAIVNANPRQFVKIILTD